jgi:hypothetical protein
MHFTDETEFIIAILNLYLTEKRQSQLRSSHHYADMPLKHPEAFLDFPKLHPRPRDMLNSFRQLQHRFFHQLANVPMRPPTNYNPFKRLADEKEDERKAHERARKAQ